MKKHSAFRNELWLIKLVSGYEKRYPLLLSATVAAKLLLPLVSALLPAAAVALLTRGGMGRFLAVVGGLMILFAAGTFLRDWLENRSFVLLNNFRMEVCVAMLMEKILAMDYSKLESAEGQRRMAAAKNMAGNPMAGGVDGMVRAVEPWLCSLLGILIYGAAAAALDFRILLVLIGMTVANHAAAVLVTRYERRTRNETNQLDREHYYILEQSDKPENGKDVRLYHMENWFFTSLMGTFRKQWAWRRGYDRRRLAGKISDTLFLALRDIVAYTVLVSSFLSGRLDAAGFTFSLGVLMTLTNWLNSFITENGNIIRCSIGFNDYRNFIEEDDAVKREGTGKRSLSAAPPRVEFRDVTFTYPNAETPAIDHLSLTLEPGEKVALVGRNGAGKTTLVKLLTGLYRPDRGEILIDGVSAEEFGQEEYFRLVGTVFQDVSLLPFTIGENVAGREKYDPKPVWESLEKAGLCQAAEGLPKGLDTCLTQQMEKDGVELSGGQRQRLSFARALYKDAPLLILDEPTSALDPLAEADLYRRYAGEITDKTSVFVSHRLGSTRFCDRVVYMEKGRITEMGSHQELLKLGGAYAGLFETQSVWYQEKKGESHEEI